MPGNSRLDIGAQAVLCHARVGARRAPKEGEGSSAAPDPPGPMQRSREAVLREAQKQLGDLLDAVINAAPDAPAAMVVSAIDADVASQVADAITTALEAHGVRRGKRGATYCAVPSPLWRMR